MSKKVHDCLTDEQMSLLSGDRYAIVSTLDHLTGAPNIHAISWLFASDNKTILLAAGYKSHITKNIKKNKKMTIALIGDETTTSISGTAKIKEESIDQVTIKLTLVELQVEEVRDAMFFGGKITQEPAYVKTYDQELVRRLDQEVVEAFKNKEQKKDCQA